MQSGKTALITGASSGIGLELTKLFAHDGYDLILVARSEQQLQRLASELHEKLGITVKVIVKEYGNAGGAQYAGTNALSQFKAFHQS